MPARMWWGLLARLTRNRFNVHCSWSPGEKETIALCWCLCQCWILLFAPTPEKGLQGLTKRLAEHWVGKGEPLAETRRFWRRKDNKLSQYYRNNLSSSPAGSKKSSEKDVRKRGKGRWEEKASAPPDTIFLIREGLPWPSVKTQSWLHEPPAFPMTLGRQKPYSQYREVRITGPFQFFTAPLDRGPGWTRHVHQFSKWATIPLREKEITFYSTTAADRNLH